MNPSPAVIIGRVKIGGNSYIGPGVVIRADRFSTVDGIARIEIGANCSVQDTAVIHARAETFIVIRDDTSISHGVIIHGPTTIGNKCFVGARSIIPMPWLATAYISEAMLLLKMLHWQMKALCQQRGNRRPGNDHTASQDYCQGDGIHTEVCCGK